MIIAYYTDTSGKVTGATALPDVPREMRERFEKAVYGADAILGFENCNPHIIEAENGGLLAFLALNGAANFMTDAIAPPCDRPGA